MKKRCIVLLLCVPITAYSVKANKTKSSDAAKNWRVRRKAKKSHLPSDKWYKLGLQEEGIYKIDPSQIDLSGVEPTTIKLYNGRSKMVTDSLDTLKELSIYVLPDTSILFYATSLAGWGKMVKPF